MRIFILLVMLVLSTATRPLAAEHLDASPPNIVFIMADDME